MPPPSDAALQDRVRQQAIVAELSSRALAGADLGALFRYAVDSATIAIRAPIACIFQLQGEEAVLKAAAGMQESTENGIYTHAGEGSQLRFVITARDPVLIHDIAAERRFRPDQLLERHGAISGIASPISGHDGEWGMIGIFETHQRYFSRDDLHFVQAVSNVLAYAIARQQADDRLRDSESRARAVLNTTVDGIITIDERARITSFNHAAEQIFGYTEQEVMGQNVHMLMPEPYHSEHDGYIRSYQETGRRKIIGIGREVTGRRKDGSTFPLDLAVSEVRLQGRTVFTGVVRDISERRRLELEVLRISDDERRRIGQDLHDGLGQQLTGIGLISRSLARNLEKQGHPAAEQAEEVTRLIKEADELARQLARGLVPVEMGPEGLSAALERLALNATRLFHVECAFDASVDSTALLNDKEVPNHLYRIAQEALSNAVRHGQATLVTMSLVGTEERLRLVIRDNGIGIPDEVLDASRSHDTMSGMGLRIMHYRARIIGGSADIRRGTDGGTVVTFTLPPSSDSPAFRSTQTSSTTE